MNGSESIDYGAIIADLEAKRAALDATLTAFRAAQALGALGQLGDASAASTLVPSVSGGEVPAGAFLGKSIPEAAKLYLAIVKRKQTSREIADALKNGGIESTAKNFYGNVHAILDRARKAGSGIIKLGRSNWGLAEWYPAGLRSSAAGAEKASPKRRRGRPRKPESRARAAPAMEGPKPKERILQVLRNQPGIEMSMHELADHLKMSGRAVNAVLVSLARKEMVQKTASGKYRAAA
jgi:Adenosine deaminase z-alpha domain